MQKHKIIHVNNYLLFMQSLGTYSRSAVFQKKCRRNFVQDLNLNLDLNQFKLLETLVKLFISSINILDSYTFKVITFDT